MIRTKIFYTDNNNTAGLERELNFFIMDMVEEVISVNTTFGTIMKPGNTFLSNYLITTLIYKQKRTPLFNFVEENTTSNETGSRTIYKLVMPSNVLSHISILNHLKIHAISFPTIDGIKTNYNAYSCYATEPVECASFKDAVRFCKEIIFKNLYDNIMNLEEVNESR